ncbi:hypothetical protein [Amedibacillus sp. YH-ame10]
MKKWKLVIDEIFKENLLSHRKLYYTYTYVHMVLGEEKNLINRKVSNIEKIIFLSQCYSLEKDGHSIVDFNTYIFEGRVYFKYLSDLLRVSKISGFYGEPIAKDFNRITNHHYHKVIEKYSKLSEDEIEREFKEKIKKVENDENNFLHKKCEFTIARLLARHSAWRYNHAAILPLLKTALSYLCAGFVLAWIVYIIALCLTPFGIFLGILKLDVASLIVISILIFPVWIFWTFKILHPTDYEMSNDYNKDFNYKWFSNKKIK